MTIAEFFTALRKRWWYVFVPVVVACVASVVWSKMTDPVYVSRASVYFSLPFASSANDLNQGVTYTQQQVGSYAQLATKPIVLQRVITDLHLSTTPKLLADSVGAKPLPDSVIVDISASGSTPERSAQLANSVATQLGVVVQDLSPKSESGRSSVQVTTVAAATPPSFASVPNTRQNLAVAGLGSFLLGLVLALARERLDNRVRDESDLPPNVGVLGTIQDNRDARRNPLLFGRKIAGTSLSSRRAQVRAESFRWLRTRLRFADVDNPIRVLVVTSSVSGEGKTSTVVNLAYSLAEGGERVLLIDGDLRRPRVASHLGVEGSIGLTDVLAGTVSIETATQRYTTDNFFILASGPSPANPSELFGTQAMADLIRNARAAYDLVLIDTPPLLPVIDAAVVGAAADGVMLVVRYGKTTTQQVEGAIDALRSVDARLLGVVINRAPSGRPWNMTTSYYSTRQGQRASGEPVAERSSRLSVLRRMP